MRALIAFEDGTCEMQPGAKTQPKRTHSHRGPSQHVIVVLLQMLDLLLVSDQNDPVG